MAKTKLFVLSCSFCLPSAQRLAASLGDDVTVGKQPPNRTAKFTHLLRWGSTVDPTLDEEFEGRTLNTAAAIGTSSNRLSMLLALRSRNLPTPQFYRDVNPTNAVKDIKWLRRDRYSRCGDDVRLLAASEPSRFGLLAVEYIPCDYEVRYHVFRGTTILKQIKVYPGAGPPPQIAPDVFVRNYDNGWRLYPITPTNLHHFGITNFPHSAVKSLEGTAATALSAVGLQHGVADFLLRESGKGWVLETNSAPGIEGYSVACWQHAVKSWLEGA